VGYADRHRLLFALILLVTVLFVSAGYPPVARWRRQLRLAAAIGFVVALAAALVDIACWWLGFCA
jgi:hypothetical protein